MKFIAKAVCALRSEIIRIPIFVANFKFQIYV